MIDKIIVTYIYHSCYTVEIGAYFLIFDYFKGILNIPDDKNVIFISSHSHDDHYTSEILKVPNMEDKTYILSSDIGELEKEKNVIFIRNNELSIDQLKTLYNSRNVHFVRPDGTYNINLAQNGKVRVKTFGSTDQGISILINIEGINIFHAGDLNFWAWPDNDDITMRDELDSYMAEIENIKKNDIDIAFVPVDYRLAENYDKGAVIFIEEVKPQVLFPMHSGSHEDITVKFVKEHKFKNTFVRSIYEQNQKTVININEI